MSLAFFDSPGLGSLIAPQKVKKCSTCGENKPVAFFSKKNCNPDGLCTQCKDCVAKCRKRYRADSCIAQKERTQSSQRYLDKKRNLAKLSEQCVYIFAWKNYPSSLKIGKSTNLCNRFNQALCSSPDTLLLISIVSTDDAHALEQKLHQIFAPFRLHGEWFQASSFVLRYIDTLSSELAEQMVPLLSPYQQSRIQIISPQDYIDRAPFLGK